MLFIITENVYKSIKQKLENEQFTLSLQFTPRSLSVDCSRCIKANTTLT